MNIPGPELASKQAACLTAARQLGGRFGWRLLADADWADQAAGICTATTEKDAFQACLNVYSRALYDACCNAQDAAHQKQAYTELHYYLFQKAQWLCPDDWVEEAAQTTLAQIFEKIGQCRDPGAFLLWAWNWLRAAIKKISRPYQYEIQMPDRKDDDSWDDDARGDDLQDDAAWIVDEIARLFDEPQVIDDLRDCITQALQQNPGARRQMCALLWKYFDEYSAQKIATILNTTVGAVYRLRNSALKKLRECMERKGYSASSPNRKV